MQAEAEEAPPAVDFPEVEPPHPMTPEQGEGDDGGDGDQDGEEDEVEEEAEDAGSGAAPDQRCAGIPEKGKTHPPRDAVFSSPAQT